MDPKKEVAAASASSASIAPTEQSVPTAMLTATFINYLLHRHIKRCNAPVLLDMELYLAVDRVSVSNIRDINGRSIYITVASNGVFINKSKRRLQRFVVTAWATNPSYAELGGQIITKALSTKTVLSEESAPYLDDNLYRVNVSGYFRTTVTGQELVY